jgi:hypothetical protein
VPVPVFVVRISAIAEAAEGACAKFSPKESVGVVPAGLDHRVVQDQYQDKAAFGSVQVQRVTGDSAVVNVEVVKEKVQPFFAPLTSVFMFR